jgi:protein-S-isoprenylcysteine O-methyltransferase Ste14
MMYWFLVPLLFGFMCNLGSAFTTAISRRWGEHRGSIITVILRDVLGVPLWTIGFILAGRFSSPSLFTSTLAATFLGWLLITLGGTIILIALVTIRLPAALPSIKDQLVQTGIYARVRHPIHTGALLEFTGLAMINPTLPFTLASGMGLVWVFLQTWFEEIDLLERLPGYRDYLNTVPRFLPRIRIK